MANVQRVLNDFLPMRQMPVKGSVAAIQTGDLVFWDTRFQANTNQQTIRPASSGSAGASAADGRAQFSTLFCGVAAERHDLNSYDKNQPVHVDCEAEFTIANSSGVATVANADIAPGTKVGVAVNSSNIPLDGGLVQIQGLHSVTIADGEAIGTLSRQIKNGDKTCRVHVKSTLVFSQTGI